MAGLFDDVDPPPRRVRESDRIVNPWTQPSRPMAERLADPRGHAYWAGVDAARAHLDRDQVLRRHYADADEGVRAYFRDGYRLGALVRDRHGRRETEQDWMERERVRRDARQLYQHPLEGR